MSNSNTSPNPLSRITNWYFSRATLPHWCILALDCLIVFCAGFPIYYLTHSGMDFMKNFWLVALGMLVTVVISLIFYIGLHTYRGVIRYSSFIDLYRIACANLCAGVLVSVISVIQEHINWTEIIITPNPKSALFIFIIATALMWGVRVLVKILYDIARSGQGEENIFIYGCREGGVALAKSIRNQSTTNFRLRGFISGDKTIEGSWLLGEKVYYDDDNVVKEMQRRKVSVLLISPLQTERFTSRTSLIDALINADIKIRMMPQSEEWDGKSDLSFQQLHEVDIEDLLPREKIEVDMKAIGEMLTGKRILITGAAGSIGSEMARQVAKFKPSELVLIDQAETPMHDVRLYMARNHADLKVHTIVTTICNQVRMESIFAQYRPEYVFHAAAYKHVPMMEDNPSEAIQNNVYGTRVIADLAVKYGTRKFVMISTDKAVNPTNVMGCSKRICEIYCQALNKAIQEGNTGSYPNLTAPATAEGKQEKPVTQFVTTRFGNVLGSNGSVIPIFREQIRKGGPVMVTHPDIIRFFMLIPEACRLVLEAGTMGKGGEIFVFDMGEPVKIVDLARRMIRLSGAKNVEIKFSGLRDGEKLFEEVLNDAEQTKPTHHPKIKVASVREYPYDLALANEKELHDISYNGTDMDIVRKMKAIVPEYVSHHSKYEALDKEREKA